MASIEEPLKSRRSLERSFIKFTNRTRHPVDIIWKDFNGKNIRYASRLAPSHHYCVDTFVFHPWIAWNSDTLNLLNTGGGTVFYPIKWDGQARRTEIFIDEPVHTLVRLCLEKVKSLVNLGNVDKLNIPRVLISELKRRRAVEVHDYRRIT